MLSDFSANQKIKKVTDSFKDFAGFVTLMLIGVVFCITSTIVGMSAILIPSIVVSSLTAQTFEIQLSENASFINDSNSAVVTAFPSRYLLSGSYHGHNVNLSQFSSQDSNWIKEHVLDHGQPSVISVRGHEIGNEISVNWLIKNT
ncbi:MAG: hypothetical protein ACRCXZ_04335 [Patescibacteria group bacterium]